MTLEGTREADSGQRMTVVLAEDDQSLNALLARVLESAGHRVLTAENGLETLTLVQRFPTERTRGAISLDRR